MLDDLRHVWASRNYVELVGLLGQNKLLVNVKIKKKCLMLTCVLINLFKKYIVKNKVQWPQLTA